jgi:hypothetical protein
MISGLTARDLPLYSYPFRDNAFAREGGKHYHPGDAGRAGQRKLDVFWKKLGQVVPWQDRSQTPVRPTNYPKLPR